MIEILVWTFYMNNSSINSFKYCFILFLLFSLSSLRKWNCSSGIQIFFSWHCFWNRSLTIGQMQGKFQMVVVRHTGHAIQVCTSQVSCFIHYVVFWFSSLICNLISSILIYLGRCTWWICNSGYQLYFSQQNRPSWSWGMHLSHFLPVLFTTVLQIILILL